MSTTKYKKPEDLAYIKKIPPYWEGYDNPVITATVKADVEEWKLDILKQELGTALVRWSSLTGTSLKAEIKPPTNE